MGSGPATLVSSMLLDQARDLPHPRHLYLLLPSPKHLPHFLQVLTQIHLFSEALPGHWIWNCSCPALPCIVPSSVLLPSIALSTYEFTPLQRFFPPEMIYIKKSVGEIIFSKKQKKKYISRAERTRDRHEHFQIVWPLLAGNHPSAGKDTRDRV